MFENLFDIDVYTQVFKVKCYVFLMVTPLDILGVIKSELLINVIKVFKNMKPK